MAFFVVGNIWWNLWAIQHFSRSIYNSKSLHTQITSEKTVDNKSRNMTSLITFYYYHSATHPVPDTVDCRYNNWYNYLTLLCVRSNTQNVEWKKCDDVKRSREGKKTNSLSVWKCIKSADTRNSTNFSSLLCVDVEFSGSPRIYKERVLDGEKKHVQSVYAF